jgi:hypothetical protein
MISGAVTGLGLSGGLFIHYFSQRQRERLANSRDDPCTMEPMKPMSGMIPMSPMKPIAPMMAPERWWPQELGDNPNSAGGQNETRYAFFAEKKRLAVDLGEGNVQLYETGDHRISGVQQHQGSGGKEVIFTSQLGEVSLEKLKPV